MAQDLTSLVGHLRRLRSDWWQQIVQVVTTWPHGDAGDDCLCFFSQTWKLIGTGLELGKNWSQVNSSGQKCSAVGAREFLQRLPSHCLLSSIFQRSLC